MNSLTNHSYRNILEGIAGIAEQRIPKKQFSLFSVFTQQYYAHADLETLKNRSVKDLAASVISHWKLAYQRLPNQTKIHVFDTDSKQDIWETTGSTVLEYVTDDKPFLVDSTRMEINHEGFGILFINHVGDIKVQRDLAGRIVQVLPSDAKSFNGHIEAWVHIEITKAPDQAARERLADKVGTVLDQVELVVQDWPKMCEKMRGCLQELEQNSPPYDPEDVAESQDFLRWLLNEHFTFLGYRDYELSKDRKTLRMDKSSGLGVLRCDSRSKVEKLLTELPPEARRLAFSPQVLVISKTNTKASVHRPAYADYIGIKHFDKGKLIGERRFIGLYTSTVYHSDPRHIPLIRRKIKLVLNNSRLPLQGHAGKELLDILSSFPRDDLFQASADELTQLSLGILYIQERQALRLFVRQDTYRRFISCLVYLPKEKLNTDLQKKMEKILVHEFSGIEIGFSTSFGESNLVRIHFLVRTDPKKELSYDVKKIESKLVDVARSWKEELRQALIAHYGEAHGGRLIQKYEYAFPSGYRDTFLASAAVHDIEHIESISLDHPLSMNFYHPNNAEKTVPLRFKLFQANRPIVLSDVLPVLENMGLRVIDEWPQEITLSDGQRVWINDFGVKSVQVDEVDVAHVKEIFQEAFHRIWFGEVENDGFNRLILAGQLTWREISILRAYTKYLRQIGVPFSQTYIESAVSRNASIAKILIQLFKYYFDPKRQEESKSIIKGLENSLQTALDTVASLDEDRILRRLFEVIQATLRTNYFQKNKLGKPKNWLAFKLNPARISDLPLPRPLYEIFIYSPRVEAVHLRAAKVARGGIRWSDRREDFRTEILGLLKAQQVKNVVTATDGAKGGFVCKQFSEGGDREAILDEVKLCYEIFMRGLLDLTDNLRNGILVPPPDVVRYDDDDPYLVVAADKGTASFSDIANAIAAEPEYDFWLGDAYASGGSVGYDHKKMGITARGAWKSAERHGRTLGLNLNKK